MKQGLLFLVAISFACSGDPGGVDLSHTGPYGDIPAQSVVRVAGLDGPVDIVTDRFGVPHVYGQSIGDAVFGQGYVMAADRLPQMNLFRHFASGTVSELFGALDRNQIDGDLRMRMHMFRPLAKRTLDMLQASNDPTDQEIVKFLQRFSDGVNQYLGELKADQHSIDRRVATFFDPARTENWTPLDTLTIGRLEAWAQDYVADEEIFATQMLDAGQRNFSASSPPAQARRAGLVPDLFPVRPLDATSTVDGFPGGGRRPSPVGSPERPHVSAATLSEALATVRPHDLLGVKFRDLFHGSNNWVVSLPGGKAILANDPHLQLSNPSILWFVHLTVPGQMDVAGMTVPGVPGIILGHNAHIAWGGTDVYHDAVDVYKETVAPCGNMQNCVTWKGQQVPIETRQETLRIAALGTGSETLTVTYEVVPHHGPIIPTIANHKIVARPNATEALSVRYAGYEPTFEVRAIFKLMRATSVDEAFAALEDWSYGALNWVVIDDAGHIGWYPHAHIPWRTTPGCFTYDKRTNVRGTTPFAVLPGDGSCEWEGYMESQYIPRAKDPASGFLATANADPVGATFDDDALNGPTVNGHRVYLNGHYDPGYRVGRITRRLEAARGMGRPLTLDDMASIQADAHSNYGDSMRPHLVAALAALAAEIAQPGTHPDIATFVSGMPAERKSALMALKPLLEGWSLETPAATDASAPMADIMDSAATSLFNVWVRRFLQRAFGDELNLLGAGVHDYLTPRVGLWVFDHPEYLITGVATETGQPLLCDDLTTPNVFESCTYDALAALDDAVGWLTTKFASAAPTDWRWGKLHTLTLSSQLPDNELNVPPPDDPNPALRGGYPRHGDNFSVDASMPGFVGDDYTYGSGPVMRHLTTFAAPGKPVTRQSLPGGEVFDRSSPHYRDLMDNYWSQNKYFDFAFSIAEVHTVAEGRVRLQPAAK